MEYTFVPSAIRAASDLRAKARLLRNMAEAATTPEVTAALLRLAGRYERAAAAAESEDIQSQPAAPAGYRLGCGPDDEARIERWQAGNRDD